MFRVTLWASVFLLLLAAATRLDPLPQGLTAAYFTDANWSSTPVRTAIESRPSTDTLRDAWGGTPPETFSVTWTGLLLVTRAGDYVFESDSDDGAWLYIDGRLVVDDGGRHADLPVRGTVRLARGVHQIFIRYFQDGGEYAYGLRWAVDGAPLAPVPTWALWARRAEFSRMLASALVRRTVATAFGIWAAIVLATLVVAARRPVQRWTAHIWTDPTRRALACVILASALLNVVGIGWGLPSAWAGDELTPKAILIAASQHFSSGWFDRYPPLQFYVLTLAYSPWLIVDALGWVHLADVPQVTLLATLGRLVSVAAAAGTIAAVYVCGARAFGRRAGLFAAMAMALVPVFVYYAKTANPEVPYVFWFTAALAFFLRALDTGALRDVALFCACAAMSICTKDQAYALFISLPFVLMFRWRSVADRRLVVGGAVGIAVFALVQNIPLNAHGFVAHVRDITGPGSNYRMFAPTLAGQWSLLAMSAALDVRTLGWPLFLASAAGFVIAIRDKRQRSPAIVLALVAATYYAGFIAVVLYDYDRYLLPICVVQALFAGVAAERIWSARRVRPLGMIAVAALFAYSFLYAATVDLLMVRDSRYDAEAWLQKQAGRDRLVALTFPDVVNPRTLTFRSVYIHSVADLRKWEPDFFVLNSDYARALAPHRPEAPLVVGLQQGALGYHLVYRHRTMPPWPWLPGAHPDLVGPRLETPVLSFLRDLSPAIEIYEREGS